MARPNYLRIEKGVTVDLRTIYPVTKYTTLIPGMLALVKADLENKVLWIEEQARKIRKRISNPIVCRGSVVCVRRLKSGLLHASIPALTDCEMAVRIPSIIDDLINCRVKIMQGQTC